MLPLEPPVGIFRILFESDSIGFCIAVDDPVGFRFFKEHNAKYTQCCRANDVELIRDNAAVGTQDFEYFLMA